jgi:hypothetical protein
MAFVFFSSDVQHLRIDHQQSRTGVLFTQGRKQASIALFVNLIEADSKIFLRWL